MYVKAKVTPGAKVEKVERKADDLFVLAVREPAERNLANRRVAEIIAREFKVPVGKARIVSGHRSGSKILSVETGEAE